MSDVTPIYAKKQVGFVKDGVRYHICGRPWDKCQQFNGQFWCEIVEAKAREPYERGDSMG